MKFKKKLNIDTKLAVKGIRYDPNFIVSDDDSEDLTNHDVQLKDLKNVDATPSRITRSQGPTLTVRNGDTLAITVVSRARYNVTIHCIMVEEDSNKLDKQEEEDHEELVLKSSKNKKDDMSSTTTSTMRRKNNKCTAGASVGASKKDRHNKINMAHGPRDQRMRLTPNSSQIFQFSRLARLR
ncbi:hypothetical protein BC332_31192 [Capsicum chinense]|nr:hypothetical protein BC332_31192 [Capsicum chinense]